MRIGLILRYIAFFWVVILSVATLEYVDFKTDTGFLQLKQQAVRSGWYLPAFYLHIFGSSLILIAGFFQFSPKIRINLTLHRWLGRIYVYGILLMAAPGALVMTFFINRGNGVFISFLAQNILWVIFTLYSIIAAQKKQFSQHSHMAIRSYSLAFAAVTLRFYIWLFHILGTGVHFENNYLIIAWLSWVPNLLIAEWVIRKNNYSTGN